MRTRTAVATGVLAVAGLVVSLTALWPRPDPGTLFPVVEPGPSALRGAGIAARPAARLAPLDRGEVVASSAPPKRLARYAFR